MGVLAGIGLSYLGYGATTVAAGALGAAALTGGKGVGEQIVGGAVGSLLGVQKPQTPAGPALANVKPPTSPAGSAAKVAGLQQLKRTVGAQGRGSTIKTGPQGLGDIPSQNTAPKSLLGY